MTIKKTDKIADVVSKNPEAAEVMFNCGMFCVGCPAAMMETIEDGCKGHGMTDEQIDEMVVELNKKEKKKK